MTMARCNAGLVKPGAPFQRAQFGPDFRGLDKVQPDLAAAVSPLTMVFLLDDRVYSVCKSQAGWHWREVVVRSAWIVRVEPLATVCG